MTFYSLLNLNISTISLKPLNFSKSALRLVNLILNETLAFSFFMGFPTIFTSAELIISALKKKIQFLQTFHFCYSLSAQQRCLSR